MGLILYNLLSAFSVVFIMFFILWLVHLVIKNAGIVDLGWGIGFIFITIVYSLNLPGLSLRKWLMFLMIAFWGLRITVFLIKRLWSDTEEDPRYQRVRNTWGNNINLKFFFIFEVQAVIQIFMSLPILVACLNTREEISSLEILGLIIFATSLLLEAVADEQLNKFKLDPSNKGKVCDRGLWNYSRHPNYFFEFMIWVGIFIFALGSPWGWISVLSPIIILYLVTKVSGIPMAEAQALKTRGDAYRAYQQTTSVFIPLPKKKKDKEL